MVKPSWIIQYWRMVKSACVNSKLSVKKNGIVEIDRVHSKPSRVTKPGSIRHLPMSSCKNFITRKRMRMLLRQKLIEIKFNLWVRFTGTIWKTFGISPQYDRVAQLAGIRTDINLNPDIRNWIYCKTSLTFVDPESCLITGNHSARM